MLTPPMVIPGLDQISGLLGGVTYYVQVEDLTNTGDGCTSVVVPVTIPQFTTTISVGGSLGTDFNITHQEDCTPANGEIEILNITETRPNGTTIDILGSGGARTVGDYQFEWFENDKVTPIAAVAPVTFPNGANGTDGANIVSGLTADTYYLKITNTVATGCEQPLSQYVEFVIEDQTVDPTLSVVVTAQDISCDDVTPTGAATATVTNIGAAAVGDYAFTWFIDAGTTPINGANVPTASFSSSVNANTTNGDPGLDQISGLLGGVTYYVQVEDLTNEAGDGCTSVVVPVTIPQFTTTISVGGSLGTDFNITHQEDCTPANGEIEILNITETRPNGTTIDILGSGGARTVGDYQFEWFENDKVTPIAAVAPVTFPNGANGTDGANIVSGLTADTYYLKITNTVATGCEQPLSQYVEFVIEDQTVDPTLSVVVTAQDISCDDVTPTGAATATITNIVGTADLEDYATLHGT